MAEIAPKNAPALDLDTRVNPSIDYTRRDEFVDAIIDLVTCPILREPSSNMVIFNLQCYDRESFQAHRRNEEARNMRLQESGI